MQEPKGMFAVEGEPKIVEETRRRILREFEDLEFVEEGHIYRLHGQEITATVSQIGHRFIREPFDQQLQADRCAVKRGVPASDLIEEWDKNSFRATALGTKTHAYGESLAYLRAGHPELILDTIRPQYMAEYGYLAPIHPKEVAVEKFLTELPSSLHLVLNETMVYSGKNPDAERNLKELICGTFDMLYYYDGQGDATKAGFVVLDYKTNSDLYSEYNLRIGRTLLPPFDDMVEQNVANYTIQLSLYSLMLEDIGIPIIARRIVWLKDDGTYQSIRVADVSERLRAVL